MIKTTPTIVFVHCCVIDGKTVCSIDRIYDVGDVERQVNHMYLRVTLASARRLTTIFGRIKPTSVVILPTNIGVMCMYSRGIPMS